LRLPCVQDVGKSAKQLRESRRSGGFAILFAGKLATQYVLNLCIDRVVSRAAEWWRLVIFLTENVLQTANKVALRIA
jgi:hypothetical protein